MIDAVSLLQLPTELIFFSLSSPFDTPKHSVMGKTLIRWSCTRHSKVTYTLSASILHCVSPSSNPGNVSHSTTIMLLLLLNDAYDDDAKCLQSSPNELPEMTGSVAPSKARILLLLLLPVDYFLFV
jgi:hypothetical protein